MTTPNGITRREAIARTALLLGGTLAASTIAGAERAAWAATPASGWQPRTLTVSQSELVATIAEHIIPTTDTPGARAAGVHRFVDALLTDYYGDDERKRFLAGLRAVNVRAMRECGAPFLRCSHGEQVKLLTALDAEAYASKETVTAMAQPPAAAVDGMPEEVRREMKSGWFFRRMKELTLLGYYTSEVGATKELHVAPMGAYHGDVAYPSVGRTWA